MIAVTSPALAPVHQAGKSFKTGIFSPAHGLIILLIILLLPPTALLAGDRPVGEECQTLTEMTVTDTLVTPTRTADDLMHSGNRVTRAGLEHSGPGAVSSIFKILDLLSGIDTELTDPFGIGLKEVRIRGIRGRFSGMSIEGLPNYGIMSIGPRDNLYDPENLKAVDLYKGSTPLSLNTGSGNRGGAVALYYRRPAEKTALEVSQQFGSDQARRTFFRLDSGRLPTETAFFISASRTNLNKWKGCGNLGPRNHFTAGLTQPLGKSGNFAFFYNYNSYKRHDFRHMNYDQAKDLDNFYNFDYNCSLSGSPTVDIDFYDYHHTDSRNQEYLGIFDFEPATGHHLALKPYYSYEKSRILDGPADKATDLERYGLTSTWRAELETLQFSAGYWFEASDLKKHVRGNAITPTGRIYKGWKYLTRNHGNGTIHSPWLQLGRSFGPLTCQAGLKYFFYEEPASTAYFGKAAAGTPYDYDEAVRNNLGKDSALSLEKMSYNAWLPSLAVGWQASPELEIYLNYGRNYMRPYAYVPAAVIYANNRKSFQQAGLVLQDIIDDWKMETSDNFDLGLRWSGPWCDLNPTLFYTRHRNLLCLTWDPAVGVNYYRNVGDATAYGAELGMTLYPLDNLLIFFNPSITRMEFDDDLEQGGHRLKISGNQFPDTPRFLLKTGLIWTLGGFSLMPIFKYTGHRYGDPENQQRIPGYGTLDLDLRYRRKDILGCREIEIGLNLTNLFDREHIGAIIAQDDGSGSAFYAAPPFTAMFSLKAKF